MRPVVTANRPLLLWLLLWTFAIVFLPFPTALLSIGGDQAITKVLYIGTLAVSSFCLAFLAVAIGRDRSVRESDEAPSAAPAVATGVLFVVALLVSLLVPSTGYYPLLLLVATDGVISLWHKLIARLRS